MFDAMKTKALALCYDLTGSQDPARVELLAEALREAAREGAANPRLHPSCNYEAAIYCNKCGWLGPNGEHANQVCKACEFYGSECVGCKDKRVPGWDRCDCDASMMHGKCVHTHQEGGAK